MHERGVKIVGDLLNSLYTEGHRFNMMTLACMHACMHGGCKTIRMQLKPKQAQLPTHIQRAHDRLHGNVSVHTFIRIVKPLSDGRVAVIDGRVPNARACQLGGAWAADVGGKCAGGMVQCCQIEVAG